MGLTISRQTASYLTVSRQKRLFFTVNRQKCKVILIVKTFQGISNLSISDDLHGILVPEESLHLKNHGPCCQKHSLLTL